MDSVLDFGPHSCDDGASSSTLADSVFPGPSIEDAEPGESDDIVRSQAVVEGPLVGVPTSVGIAQSAMFFIVDSFDAKTVQADEIWRSMRRITRRRWLSLKTRLLFFGLCRRGRRPDGLFESLTTSGVSTGNAFECRQNGDFSFPEPVMGYSGPLAQAIPTRGTLVTAPSSLDRAFSCDLGANQFFKCVLLQLGPSGAESLLAGVDGSLHTLLASIVAGRDLLA